MAPGVKFAPLLRHRLIMGTLLVGSALAALWLDEALQQARWPGWLHWLSTSRTTFPPGVLIFILCAGIAVLAARELARILTENGVTASRRITCTAAVAGLLPASLIPSDVPALEAVAITSSTAVVMLLAALAFYSRNKTVEGTVAAAGGTLLSFVYIGVLGSFLLAVRRDHSVWILLWVLLVAKTCDIGAYFTGRSIGRHKLIPWLSPGKTWEGLIGGMLAAAAAGAGGVILLRLAGHTAIPGPLNGAAAGAVFGLVGQMGDLIESMFKRDAGRKDSGRILPGFGGVLDLIDSPLLVAPAAYWWLTVFARAPGVGGG